MAARLLLILGSAVLHLCTPYSPPEASAYADQSDTILAFKLSRKMPVLPAEVAEYRGDDAGVYVQRGMINFQLGHLNRSLGDFDRAIELEPGTTCHLSAFPPPPACIWDVPSHVMQVCGRGYGSAD